jgi:predicted nuclease with TOPRIM domain
MTPEEIQKIKEMLEEHERRLSKLESLFTSKKEVVKDTKKRYKGLAGGIRLLIDNGFFSSPKDLNEIIAELKREGYYNSKAGVASTLSETFTKSQKVLNRIEENKVWKYVVRK